MSGVISFCRPRGSQATVHPSSPAPKSSSEAFQFVRRAGLVVPRAARDHQRIALRALRRISAAIFEFQIDPAFQHVDDC